jgi:hypothetical protein
VVDHQVEEGDEDDDDDEVVVEVHPEVGSDTYDGDDLVQDRSLVVHQHLRVVVGN